MTDFFRFPHTPHLAWLGAGTPRDDKVLSPDEAMALLDGNVIVEEKLDGANLGISFNDDGSIRAQNRGQYLEPPFHSQFSRLASWLAPRIENLASALGIHLILFGEWCEARHSLEYTDLPDWFLVFDVYDRGSGRFWSTARRDELAAILELSTVPRVMAGKTSLPELTNLLTRASSSFGPQQLEGVIIRRENELRLEARAKLVHPDFTQSITDHWSRRGMEWNRLHQA